MRFVDESNMGWDARYCVENGEAGVTI